jgi:pyridoxamine 5'-phosphate oxidase
MPLTSEQLAALRLDYAARGLSRDDLDADPIAQFNHWLGEAIQQELVEPNAMILATVDDSGQPWTRTVLLKVCDQRGFAFFTNYESKKGRQLANNPRAALTIWWGALARQVNITGNVSKTSTEESRSYFQSRPVASQLGAWASRQSEVLANRAELERGFEEAKAKFGEASVPLPPHWGGYVVAPQFIEFWQGRRSRLHDRFRYARQADNSWKIDRLSP